MIKIEVSDSGSIETTLSGSGIKVMGQLGLSFAVALWKAVGGDKHTYLALMDVLYRANITDELINRIENLSVDTRADIRAESKEDLEAVLEAMRKEGDGHVS